MDQTKISLPGYRINEYRLVVPIPEHLQEKLQSVRNRLHERYKVKLPFELKPALTLLRAHSFEKTESRLVERFQQVAMGTDPFQVELENFAAYPSHSIYVQVGTRSPFLDLGRELKKMKWLMNIQGYEPHFISEPHLLIAQGLKPMQFINMWMECEHSSFSGRFIADAIQLMKRDPVSGRYELLERMKFMSLSSQIKQGELFA